LGQLLEKTRARLWPMRIQNLRLKHTDGGLGLPEAAPFDAIVVAAAAPQIPIALLEQLTPEGRLVIPVGVTRQQLLVVERVDGAWRETVIEDVKFVPLKESTA